jgi:N-carbamoyl-L-amino-acid hydrolase
LTLDIETAASLAELDSAVCARQSYASSVFDALRTLSEDAPGVTRASFMEGEQAAHDEITRRARELGLGVSTDAVGNLSVRMPGRRPDLPIWITGSHLDSVHHGGNFDGAAGVIAALVAMAAMIDAGFQTERDVVLMAFRAEECSTWFVGRHGGHLGSRAALGLLWPDELDTAVHISTGLSFREMVDNAGFDAARIESGPPVLQADRIAGYVELHLEQGPILEHREIPVGIVTGIRGAYRVRNAGTLGAYSHSGAVPRELRQDAVFATADLVMALDREWSRRRIADQDLVVTFGKFSTDPDVHSIVKVPGEVKFAVDIRSQEQKVLDDMEAHLRNAADEISRQRKVTFTLDPLDRVRPAVMDPGLVGALQQAAEELGIPSLTMASGGGHDAADFAEVGVPSVMIFVRNAHGSHNPEESMELTDFMQATRLLTRLIATIAGDGMAEK